MPACRSLWILCLFAVFSAAQQKPLTRIAFGSCCDQEKPQQIWNTIGEFQPQLFIFLGDNIYGDTEDMAVLKAKYQQLASKPGYQKLRTNCPVIATWDDHDYGKNDAGREYPWKKQSQQIFLDFFGEPEDSPRRRREGIYTSYMYGPPGKRVQIILLDTRYFRTPLAEGPWPESQRKKLIGPYIPNSDLAATMLGKEQWHWLEQQLRQPAQIRIIASSIPFLMDFSGWETWANMPRERRRMLRLITKTRANGVIFISGDTHWAELSRLSPTGIYPLYDLTSSGLTEVWRGFAPNKNRIGKGYLADNFGAVVIDWDATDPTITLQIRTFAGFVAIAKKIQLSELQFGTAVAKKKER